ncbi:c6 transcription factor [Diplodia corticola]|uniref:C6 transcription factor n=1 Tax=Diplodia corticola TaxID=236234 RepID=A0A1J9R8N8_9PEZI|nr:c6 transcription factor [Diplodia corticola]OJD36538.1 c6 transcription factor [Diplodia corticola]
MSDELRTSMRKSSTDRVIAKLDDQSQQLQFSDQTDAIAHGPFAVFKCARPADAHWQNDDKHILVDFLPADFGDEQFPVSLSAIDHMFDTEQLPYSNENEQCDLSHSTSANPTDYFLTPYLNPYPESTAHQDASLLLNHYKNHVIRLLSPLKYQRKTPWNILHLPCAMTTLAEITMGYRANHARASVFYGVMSISAFNLSASSTGTARAHWDGVASSYKRQAHESLKASLGHELSAQKKAKYKEMLMAILSMVTISVFSGAVENTRAYLLDAERLIRLRGLTKPRISRKVRLLHHCYAYIRLMHETTWPSTASSSSFRIEDWQPLSSPHDAAASASATAATAASCDDNDSASASTPDPDPTTPWHRPKPFHLGVHDLHLAIPGDFAQHTLYPSVYGIPESLMQLISQTTRLGNERDAILNSPTTNPSSTPPARLFFLRAKAVETAILRQLRDDDDEEVAIDERQYEYEYVDADPAAVASNRRAVAHLRRALGAALAVYFYRRVHDAGALLLLQGLVERTIEALEAVAREDGREGEGEGEVGAGYTAGTVWPGFVAACEAEGAEMRGRFERWFEVQGARSGMPMFGRAREVVRAVWEGRDGGGGGGRGAAGAAGWSWVDVVREKGVALLCMVGLNTGPISDAPSPFGGIKHSGSRREGGKYGLDECMALKTVVTGGININYHSKF